MEENDMSRVFFITGSESTGKSTLTDRLAAHFGGIGVPEYARTYLEKLNGPYTYSDVEFIAKHQIRQIHENGVHPLVFFDTCLFNLKVWFSEVYGSVPPWLENEVPIAGRGTYLLCEPDLPWQYDPLRENPHRREYLSEQYENEIKAAGFPYFRVSGSGEERFLNAFKIVSNVITSESGHN